MKEELSTHGEHIRSWRALQLEAELSATQTQKKEEFYRLLKISTQLLFCL